MITNDIDYIIKKLEEHNFKCFVVGGAIRDYLLGFKADDYDLTTDAMPEEVISIFEGFKINTIGKKYGTIGVFINNKMYEITTFRTEGDYINHRTPQNINFVKDLRLDLQRRDFTINALAYNGTLYDYFDGYNDIKNKIIRTIGDPVERFTEDGLRILRCFRFSSHLGFEIESKTKDAAVKLFDYVLDTSWQRRSIEIKKLISGKDFIKVLNEYKALLSKLLYVFMYEDYYKLIDSKIDLYLRLMIMYLNHQDILEEDLAKLEIKKSYISYMKNVYLCYEKVDFSTVDSLKKSLENITINKNKIYGILNDVLNLKMIYKQIDSKYYNLYHQNLDKMYCI